MRFMHGPNCGGQLKVVAVILESAVIERVHTQLCPQARAPLQALNHRAGHRLALTV